MEGWVNLVGYQIVWWVAVSGAGRGESWPAWTASSLFWGGQFVASPQKALDLTVMGLCIVFGLCLDGFLASSGYVRYAPATPAAPVSGCPLWILALWLAFSTTLTRSLLWLRGRLGLAVLFGAAGGPLAYWAAAKGWSVITFEPPQWRGLLVLSTGWAAAMFILGRVVDGSKVDLQHPGPATRRELS